MVDFGTTQKKFSLAPLIQKPQVVAPISRELNNTINTIASAAVNIHEKEQAKKVADYGFKLNEAQLKYSKRIAELDPLDVQGKQEAFNEYEQEANQYVYDESIPEDKRKPLMNSHSNWSQWKIADITNTALKADEVQAQDESMGTMLHIFNQPMNERANLMKQLKTDLVSNHKSMNNQKAAKTISEQFTIMVKNNLDPSTLNPRTAREMKKAYEDTILSFDKKNEGKSWFTAGLRSLDSVINEVDKTAMTTLKAKLKVHQDRDDYVSYLDNLREIGVIPNDDIKESWLKAYDIQKTTDNTTLTNQWFKLKEVEQGQVPVEQVQAHLDVLVKNKKLLPELAKQRLEEYKEVHAFTNNPNRDNIPSIMLTDAQKKVAPKVYQEDIKGYLKAGNFVKASDVALKTNNTKIVNSYVQSALDFSNPEQLSRNIQQLTQIENQDIGLFSNVIDDDTLKTYRGLQLIMLQNNGTIREEDIKNLKSTLQLYSKSDAKYKPSDDFIETFGDNPALSYKAMEDMRFLRYIGYDEETALEITSARFKADYLDDKVEFPKRFRSTAETITDDDYKDLLNSMLKGYADSTNIEEDELSIRMNRGKLTVFHLGLPIEELIDPKTFTEDLELYKANNPPKKIVDTLSKQFKDPEKVKAKMYEMEKSVKSFPRAVRKEVIDPIIKPVEDFYGRLLDELAKWQKKQNEKVKAKIRQKRKKESK